MGSENIIKFFFHITSSIKLYHWQTTNFARHKATDDLHSTLLELIDSFVETFIGKYERPIFPSKFNLNIKTLDDEIAPIALQEYISYLTNEIPKYVDKKDTDLLNIRDEMLAILHKTLYLFTLH